jgi:hypothetical protein
LIVIHQVNAQPVPMQQQFLQKLLQLQTRFLHPPQKQQPKEIKHE